MGRTAQGSPHLQRRSRRGNATAARRRGASLEVASEADGGPEELAMSLDGVAPRRERDEDRATLAELAGSAARVDQRGLSPGAEDDLGASAVIGLPGGRGVELDAGEPELRRWGVIERLHAHLARRDGLDTP